MRVDEDDGHAALPHAYRTTTPHGQQLTFN